MLRVLELYSGIGGLHYALEESGIVHEVIAAADINDVANRIYKHNFPDTKIMQRSIESLSVKELDKLSPDLVHMSPPCQPFARVGKQQDAQDKRTKSFLHLIEVFPRMKKQPKYLFLENVKGFDTSETRQVLLDMLRESGYSCQEFLLSPLQFGIPNSRLRYYLLAKLKPLSFGFDNTEEIMQNLPACANPFLVHQQGTGITLSSTEQLHITTNNVTALDDRLSDDCQESCDGSRSVDACSHVPLRKDSFEKSNKSERIDTASSSTDCLQNTAISDTDNQHGLSEAAETLPLYKKCEATCRDLSAFLENRPEEYLDSFRIPPHFLQRFWVMDIVVPSSKNSCCFTKRYGHHIEGAGSVIQTNQQAQVDLTQYKRDRVYTEEVEKGVASMGLRFFSPREIANLMCFPANFDFPSDITTIQRYRVLGNSLNVHVVSVLLKLMVLNDNL